MWSSDHCEQAGSPAFTNIWCRKCVESSQSWWPIQQQLLCPLARCCVLAWGKDEDLWEQSKTVFWTSDGNCLVSGLRHESGDSSRKEFSIHGNLFLHPCWCQSLGRKMFFRGTKQQSINPETLAELWLPVRVLFWQIAWKKLQTFLSTLMNKRGQNVWIHQKISLEPRSVSRVIGERNFVGGFSGFGWNQQHLEGQQLPKKKKSKNDNGSFFLARYWTDTVGNNVQCCLALLKLPKRLFFHHNTWSNYSPLAEIWTSLLLLQEEPSICGWNLNSFPHPKEHPVFWLWCFIWSEWGLRDANSTDVTHAIVVASSDTSLAYKFIRMAITWPIHHASKAQFALWQLLAANC